MYADIIQGQGRDPNMFGADYLGTWESNGHVTDDVT